MTDDELRTMAKRLLDPNTGIGGGMEIDYVASGVAADDAIAVTRRLLELLPPADDGEVVTAEWMKTVGFESDGYENPWFTHESRLVVKFKRGLDPALSLAGFDTVGVKATRGHVRRLCAALGITLTEPKS